MLTWLISGVCIRFIPVRPLVKRARLTTGRLIHKNRQKLKKFFHKKKNQRKSTYILLGITVCALLSLLFVYRNHAHERTLYLENEIRTRDQRREEIKLELQNTKETLDFVEEQKATTQQELQLKKNAETELNKKVEELNAELQAKREAQAALARAVPVDTAQVINNLSTSYQIADYISTGNGYSWGYCTHYAKERRPDLPNSLGNADQWLYRAQSLGLATGSAPRVGAVATANTYMHVAIVEAVDGDQVLVSEKNYNGWNVVSQRWSHTSEWSYIY